MKKRIVLSSDEENEDEKRDSEEEWEGDDEEVVASADSAIPAHCKGTDFYIISQQIADDECLEYCVSFAAKNGGPRIELWHSEAYVREHWLPLLKAWNKQQSANDSGRRGRSQRSAASKAKQILKQSNDDEEEEEEDEEEDLDNDIKKKSTVKLKKTKKSKNHNDDDDDFGQSDEDGSEYSEEENDKKKRSASKHNNNDDDDEIVVSKSKKRKSIVIIDDDNNENDVKKTNRKKSETPSQSSSKSFQSRSSSGRSQLLNSKQEQKRLDAMEELRLIKLKGLSALSSSDDSEYEYSNDESESRVETSPRVSKPKPRATLSPYKDDFFDKKTPKSSTKRVTPKGLGLPRPLSPQPVYEEEDESDIDNFILNSDEEREEEEQRLAALEAKREKEKRKKKKMKLEKEKAKKSLQSQHADSDEEEDDDVGLKSRTKSAKKRRRSIIVDDEEEEEEEEDEDDDDEEEDEEDEEDEDDDDDLEDGPLTYLQVDLMRDERRESMEFTLRKSYTKQEAMKIYIEMLARTHIDPDFIASLVRDPQSPSSVKYSTASRQLENVICTSRESLLGSGAWNKEFVSELQARPFYMMNKINPEQAQCERCLACNRKNDHLNCKAYLCGSRYDAKRAWTGSRWDREIPSHVFIETDRTTNLQVSNTQNNRLSQQTSSSGVIELSDDEEDDDEEEGKDEEKVVDKEAEGDANKLKYWFHKYKWPHDLLKEKETKWELGSRCFSRSQLYHNLMHYKFHLLLKVKKKLLRYDKNVDAMCNDIAFISQETDRYNKLLEETQKGYGGNEHRGYKDLWNDDDDDHHPVLEAIDSSRPSNVMTQSSGGNSLLRWLGRNSNSNNQRDEIVDD